MTKQTELKSKEVDYTIVLNKVLPLREVWHMRYFVDGKKLNTKRMLEILKKDGHSVTTELEPTSCLAIEYKGIKFKSMNRGLMIKPKDEDYEKLREILLKDGYFFHSCYLPKYVKGGT